MGRPVEERFWEKVDKNGPNGCWMWTASQNGVGYGQFWTGERIIVSHRWSYEQLVGPIPNGLVIDHLCRNRACVNPEHLEPVTHRENLVRGMGFASAARKDHCSNNHPRNKKNTYFYKGLRLCRPCRAEAARAFRSRRSAA